MQPKFGGKIGNGLVDFVAVMLSKPGFVKHLVFIKGGQNIMIGPDKLGVASSQIQRGLAHGLQKQNRVMIHIGPQLSIDPSKEVLSLWMPAPPQVIGNIDQPADTFRNWGESKNFHLLFLSRRNSQRSSSFSARAHKTAISA